MRDPQRPDRPSSEDTLPPLNLSIPSTIARLKKEATAEREISDQLYLFSTYLFRTDKRGHFTFIKLYNYV